MWTPKGRTKSVHNIEVSTLVKLGVAMGHGYKEKNGPDKKCPQEWGVHKSGVLLYTQRKKGTFRFFKDAVVTTLSGKMYPSIASILNLRTIS